MTRHKTTPEGAVLRACLSLLRLRGFDPIRVNVGALRTGGRFVRFGEPGESDIKVYQPGRTWFFEVKRPGGKPSKHQQSFIDRQNALGNLAVVIDDVTKLNRVLDRLAAEPGVRAEEL